MKNQLAITGFPQIFRFRTDISTLVFLWFFTCFMWSHNTSLSAQSGCNCADFNLINGGFEQPGVPAGGLAYLNGNTFPGWETTDIQNVIEIWGSGYLGVPSYEGIDFAEINAFSFGTLFQDVLTCPGEIYYWQVAHRGRSGIDVATFELGPPIGPFAVVQTMTDGNTVWGLYSGSYTIPAGQTVTRIRLTAVTAAGGPTVGNFVDGFVFKPTFCTTDTLICPENITVDVAGGNNTTLINYDQPISSTTCPDENSDVMLTAGLPSGSNFPVGVTQVCYAASDTCGNVETCCFTVTVKSQQQEPVCDVKTIGCMKYELLSITQDASSKKTYRIRVTNNCNNPLTYTAIQLPNGMTAKKPLDNTIYTAPGGRQYLVRNPNFAPFYSIRFKSTTDSISGGESDILEYTLPAQAQPAYIHITSRLEPQQYYEAHLNTFYCPVGVTPVNKEDASAERDFTEKLPGLRVFPNPTTGLLYADLSAWAGEQVDIQVLDIRGQRVQLLAVQAGDAPQDIRLPEDLANGVYLLEVFRENGEKQAVRFVKMQ